MSCLNFRVIGERSRDHWPTSPGYGRLNELSDLSSRNDELMTAKDSDLIIIRDLDVQLKEYKRKYEQAKTELRSIKATSQIFLQTPKQVDDQLPVAPDGGLLDVHVYIATSTLQLYSLFSSSFLISGVSILTGHSFRYFFNVDYRSEVWYFL